MPADIPFISIEQMLREWVYTETTYEFVTECGFDNAMSANDDSGDNCAKEDGNIPVVEPEEE